MKKNIYYHGEPNAKYGIWKDGWKFEVCEDTPMLAMARLYQKIGHEAKKYEPRRLPKGGLPK